MEEKLQSIDVSTQDNLAEKKKDIEEQLEIFKDNVSSIKKVAEKLVTKNNLDVYNKLGSNSESTFGIIESIPNEDIVDTGMTGPIVDSLNDFRSTIVVLKDYKNNLDVYNQEVLGETQTPKQNKTYELSNVPTVPNLINEDVA